MTAKEFDAAAALAVPRRKGRPAMPADIAAARRKEANYRATTAQNWAHQALVNLHRDEYTALYAEARRQIDAERGPLSDIGSNGHDPS